MYLYIDLVVHSYSFSKGILELEVMKIVLEGNMPEIDHSKMSIEDEVLINFWENPEEVLSFLLRIL